MWKHNGNPTIEDSLIKIFSVCTPEILIDIRHSNSIKYLYRVCLHICIGIGYSQRCFILNFGKTIKTFPIRICDPNLSSAAQLFRCLMEGEG